MTADEDRALLTQLLRPPAQLASKPDAPDRVIREGRRLLRRRRVLTASSFAAVIAVVALVVGVTGVLGTGRKASEPPPAAPPTLGPQSGPALGIDQAGRFVLKDLAHPATSRVLSLGPGASGRVRADGIAANPGQGWIVTYTPTGAGDAQAATTRFAIVDLSGAMHRFGPDFPASTYVGFDVAPDGSRMALLLTAVSGLTPPKIVVMPLPGHAGATRQWSVHDQYVNEIKDLSWAPDSRRLTYIAGTDTGAGMGGNPSTLDTSAPGDTVPTASVPGTKQDCQVFAGTWLGVTGRYGAIAECPGAGGMPETHFIEIDPITARLIHLGPALPAYGCNENEIGSNSDASRILLSHCDKSYLLAGGRLTPISASQVAFVPAGNSTGTSGAGVAPTSSATPSGNGGERQPPRTIRAVLQAPSPLEYDQRTLQPGTVWTGQAFTAKLPVGLPAVMALSCGCASNTHDPDPWGNYPLISNDGGRTWQVDGPEFGRGGGGHGGSIVDRLLPLPDGGVLAWGTGSFPVYVTSDLGAHWYAAIIPSGVRAVTVHNGQLTLVADAPSATPGGYVYISNDDGLTWTLQA